MSYKTNFKESLSLHRLGVWILCPKHPQLSIYLLLYRWLVPFVIRIQGASIFELMFIFWRKFDAENLFPNIDLFPLPVYLFDKWGHHGAVFHEVVGARELLEVFVDLVEAVDAPGDHDHEEGEDAGGTLQASITAR
jgi:hypothetical protein